MIGVNCIHISSAFSNTYRNARKASKLTKDYSDLDTGAGETDLEKPRKKRKTKRFYDSDESVDKPSKIIKRGDKIIYSDSEEDNEILNAENIKQSVRALVKETQYCSKRSNKYPLVNAAGKEVPFKLSSESNVRLKAADITQATFYMSENGKSIFC